jgi:hypothetical protein
MGFYEVARVSHSFFQFSTQSDNAVIKTSKQMFFTLISPNYGVTGQLHNWFADYLKDRSQRVVVDGVAS